MAPLTRPPYTDTQRMELRSLVRLAGEGISHVWPMRTFIHHNPLHGLEDKDFEEALRLGEQLLGGRGFLSNEVYRGYVRSGRIRPEDVDRALDPLAQDKRVMLGRREVLHRDVLRAHFLTGLSAPAGDSLEAATDRSPDRTLLEELAKRLAGVLLVPDARSGMASRLQQDRHALGRHLTAGLWCDRTLGTGTRKEINGALTKWCGAFLDEGHATWAMPERGRTLYGGWKLLAQYDLGGTLSGIQEWRGKVAALPARPEDALLDSLLVLQVPKTLWLDYLCLHLAAQPGWAGFIKWRAEQGAYEWQRAYPVDLVKYLAIRLFYERELVDRACRDHLGMPGTYTAQTEFMTARGGEYLLRRDRVAGRLPAAYAHRVDRLLWGWPPGRPERWTALADRYLAEADHAGPRQTGLTAAWRLRLLAQALALSPTVLLEAAPEDLRVLLDWIEAFPESRHGPRWLEALEVGYQDQLLGQLRGTLRTAQGEAAPTQPAETRHLFQAVFCIDVRSESFRRQLEVVGGIETYGFAGFFGVPIWFRPFGGHQEFALCPVLVKPKHVVREVPRSYQGEAAQKYLAGAQLAQAGHTLLHDLKENVITPYVMVETVGWFFTWPFLGKTLFANRYDQVRAWFRRKVAPPIATTLTMDKISLGDAREMLASEQRATIRRALRERLGLYGPHLSPDLIEAIRLRALEDEGPAPGGAGDPGRALGLTPAALTGFLTDLRRHYQIERYWAEGRLHRITQTGFTLTEQAHFAETALRLMGLTRNFARLVLLCGHGSTSENNPYESALDCGACGGNHGVTNARVLAAMANKAAVRERLAQNGIVIPPDTHFLAGQHDTTTDAVRLFDLEDVPPTHRKDLLRLVRDLKEAGLHNSRERCVHFPDVGRELPPPQAARQVLRRSADWAQVRPEWGLARNAAMIVGRRELIKGLNLQGRAFLHSYDHRQDPRGRYLEIIMTAPLVVAQWINMEHYFSAVDNDVYGSGSKVYHNVVGRIGVMYGTQSDLRIGLAQQSVGIGEEPYHEPMRLLAVIEAPRARVRMIIQRNDILQRLFHLRWVNLVAFDPDDGTFYRYGADQDWQRLRM